MSAPPSTAMVLAAGLGTRMRPLTDDRPKALVEVAGRPLIGHMLDRLSQAGATTAVVNLHYFADRLEAYLAVRQAPAIRLSDERAQLLETGGGLKKARPLLGEAPIWAANIDSVWVEGAHPALPALAAAWDPARMDACLLLAPLARTLGYDGKGDFFLADDGRLSHRGDAAGAPFAYIGVQIIKPQAVDDGPEGPFSLFEVWMRMIERGRLYGVVMDGFWMHVGDPEALIAAEAKLAEGE
ncbi:MAG TPA: nucleotidyltransferase family protein [Caulobacteraceae bacterium]|nr:nucleotidyltransferase family protein [Caulobacteraceae bacterium]